MSFRIFMHALRMVFGDLLTVLKVSLPVIIVIVVGVVFFLSQIETMMMQARMPGMGMPSGIGGLFGFFLLYLIAMIWMAVSWHRYCLLAEYPGAVLPNFHGDRILAYIGKSVLLFIVFFIVGMVGSFVIGGIMAAGRGSGVMAALGGALGLVGVIFLMIAFYRLSLILPAAAIGQPLGLGEAWNATRNMTMTIVGVVIIAFLFFLIVNLVVMAITMVIPPLGAVSQIVLTWLQTVIGLSILTTIYGVAVEGRDID